MRQQSQNMGAYIAKLNQNSGVASLNGLTIKQISFASQNDQQFFRPKTLKPNLPTKIYHHGYYKTQIKHKKMLPQLINRPQVQARLVEGHKNNAIQEKSFTRSSIKNSRNSEILNSLIEILKNDPDNLAKEIQPSTRVRTQPSALNQFLQSRQISSVKNSRGPKLINNEIMMLANQNGFKRRLVSEQKNRRRIPTEQSFSQNKLNPLKNSQQDEMQLTFYRPNKAVNIIDKPTSSVIQNSERNQFIEDNS